MIPLPVMLMEKRCRIASCRGPMSPATVKTVTRPQMGVTTGTVRPGRWLRPDPTPLTPLYPPVMGIRT